VISRFCSLWLAVAAIVPVVQVLHAAPTITQQPSPVTNSVSLGASLTNRVAATTSNPPLRFQWRLNAIDVIGATNATLTLTNIQILDAGVYTVVVLDSTGSVESSPWGISVDPTFTKITAVNIVSVSGFGTAWGDYDRDGYPDLFIGTTFNNPTGYSPNELYHNRRDGTFELVPATAFPADIGGISAGWADYDNDAFIDLFVSKTGADALYHNNTNGTFSKVQNAATMESAPGFASPWADFNRDGLVDLFVANETAPNVLLQNTGNGGFLKITNWIPSGTVSSQWASWADYDNDGLPDLIVANYRGFKNLLYHNEGGGRFTSIANSPVLSIPGESSVSVWADYDNDGWLDLFMGSARTTSNALFHNNRDGTFTLVTNSVITTDIAGSHGGAWGDYDNDGHIDLLVSGGSIPCRLYHNNGDGTFARISTGSLPNEGAQQRSCAWVDYNRDGFLDAWVARTVGNSNGLYKNNGNSNAWLGVQCEGRLSNRAAIGAKVRVQATIHGQSVWQMREISSSELTAHFGLGDATNVDIVRMEWPSGIVQELRNVPARQFLGVAETGVWITPRFQELPAGTNALFTFHTELEPPAHWQWFRDGIALAGETNSELVIPNVQRANAGSYTVSITNLTTGFAFTTPASTLTGPAVISQQPVSQNIRLGSNVTFSVSATGLPPTIVQWRRDGTNIAGATQNFLTLTNVQIADEGNYTAAISDSYGTLMSSNALLTVLIRPQILVHPLSQSAVAGGSLVLSVSATGYPLPLTFRWLKNGSVVSSIIQTSTNCFFVVTNLQPPTPPNQLTYRVSVTNLAGTVTSATAVINVLPDGDGDGLPDEWELAHGLDPASASDATMDFDGDGITNLDEYRAGTEPQDSTNRPRLEIVSRPPETLQFRFWAVSNHTYRIEQRSILDSNPWSTRSELTAAPSNRWFYIESPTATDTPQFFLRLLTPNQ
jgi:enediyne biosynthesis protein E4